MVHHVVIIIAQHGMATHCAAPRCARLRCTALLSPHAGNKVARRLSEEGCQVAAWNRDASKAEAFSAAGISVHQSAQDAAQASDVLVLMLSDADAIKDVLLNGDQPVNLQGKVVVQMGTIGWPPAWTTCHLDVLLVGILKPPFDFPRLSAHFIDMFGTWFWSGPVLRRRMSGHNSI